MTIADKMSKFFPPTYRGIYVDVGAGFPVWYSNSIDFRNKGWNIIAFEPQTHMCEEFTKLGYPVHQYACTDENIGQTKFERNRAVADGMGGSALEWRGGASGSKNEMIDIEAYTLNYLMAKLYPLINVIDILDIDVEGWQFEVLKGFNLQQYRPRIIIVENILKNVEETRELLESNDYVLYERLENDYMEMWELEA